ncbi:hypothetical protein GCM10027160_28750 [Streptomyces calidiresistens]|uniref:Uncharacterized protein n=1 Tax=Streptomyces calidiresistens TaxID=1485586 RepID=A0A7W3T1W7_9ACTN|nr:hypothetical protein [Streptomyces calidiresistens]MBB0229303.1 hypothetical protein [Streptomyces calidiresistens]
MTGGKPGPLLDGGPGPGWWQQGRCWLGCDRRDLPVQWIGPVEVGVTRADMYACVDCLSRLRSLVAEETTGRP